MPSFELHRMVNESIRDTIQKTEQDMKDLGLYVCVRPIDFGNSEDQEPNVEISSLSWHLGNVEDALLDRLEIHPANERLRDEFQESALLNIRATKDASKCQVDLYDIYVRNNYLDDLDDLSDLSKELEQKLNAFSKEKSQEAFEQIQKDTRDIFLVDDFFQTVSDICQDFSENELAEYDAFYDFAVQQAGKETLPEAFRPHILHYSDTDFDADIQSFRYKMMEKLLQSHAMVSWEDLTYGSYMKACNLAKDAEDPSREVGTVCIGDVRFDVALSSSKEAPSMTFMPKIPSGKHGKDFQNLAPIKLPVRLEPPTTFETFQYRAERLMSKAIIDNHLSEQVFASKIFQKEKNRVQPLLR